jgi:ketosteroid isomerase-like protein
MSTHQPEHLSRAFQDGFNSGSLESLLALYEPGATLVIPGSGEPVTGHAAIRGALEPFLAMRGRMEIENTYCIMSGKIALMRAKWRLDGTGPDGAPVRMEGSSAEVARKQNDGRWLYLIDHPLGAG